MIRTLALRAPLVQLPANAQVISFGTGRAGDALLRFPAAGWAIDDAAAEGWAVVGDADGRRLAVEVSRGARLR